MIRYLVRRVLYAIPILIGVTLLTFILFYGVASPDTIARRNLSVKNPSEKQIHEWLSDHGYDKPLPEQFKQHMESLLLFRFGKSDQTKEPIWDRIRSGAGPSSEVAAIVVSTALVIGLTVSMLSAYFRGTPLDTSTTLLCVLMMSIVYVVYVIGLQFLLGKIFRYGPLAGYQHGIESLRFVMLPAAIGVIARFGSDVRLYRTFLLEEINQDYVRTARAKGVGEASVLFKHVLKNAAVPIVTTTVAGVPLLILGSIVLETYFGIPGLGTYLQDAIASQDFAVVRAMVYLGALLYIVGLTITDILYAALDPRVRFE
jgi:peptide/nickel transport system permease protein